ncbi:hypothetical protein KC726_02715 [Candidatus Woesebacteria bacterium]|nr:hypothetical protein [Candidatus Woesebacteria bacterium]
MSKKKIVLILSAGILFLLLIWHFFLTPSCKASERSVCPYLMSQNFSTVAGTYTRSVDREQQGNFQLDFSIVNNKQEFAATRESQELYHIVIDGNQAYLFHPVQGIWLKQPLLRFLEYKKTLGYYPKDTFDSFHSAYNTPDVVYKQRGKTNCDSSYCDKFEVGRGDIKEYMYFDQQTKQLRRLERDQDGIATDLTLTYDTEDTIAIPTSSEDAQPDTNILLDIISLSQSAGSSKLPEYVRQLQKQAQQQGDGQLSISSP